MRLGERLLLRMSRAPEASDLPAGQDQWTRENALSVLRMGYPPLLDEIKGKRVLDFGCGTGYQAVAFGLHGADYVLGVDTNEEHLRKARQLAIEASIDQKVEFRNRLVEGWRNRFDVVFSQNSMEHFPNPEAIMAQLKAAVNPGGLVLITFGPPWLAPYGSHMQFFTTLPWVNILFSEETVMRVRQRYRDDGATKYATVRGGLNAMTVSRFEKLLTKAGLKVVYKNYECVKGLAIFAQIPLLRELFVDHITIAARE